MNWVLNELGNAHSTITCIHFFSYWLYFALFWYLKHLNMLSILFSCFYTIDMITRAGLPFKLAELYFATSFSMSIVLACYSFCTRSHNHTNCGFWKRKTLTLIVLCGCSYVRLFSRWNSVFPGWFNLFLESRCFKPGWVITNKMDAFLSVCGYAYSVTLWASYFQTNTFKKNSNVHSIV